MGLTHTTFLRLADLALRLVPFLRTKPKEPDPMSARDPINYRIDTIQRALERLSSNVATVSAVVDVIQGQETPSDDVQLARARAARLTTLEAQVRELVESVDRLTDSMDRVVEWATGARQELADINGTLGTLRISINVLQDQVRELMAGRAGS